MDGVAKAEQIRAVQVSRFVGYHGRLDHDALARIKEAIRITLSLR
jgi:mRNA-degrading endonuclease toxin of MazEF toxin-antitoxin module